MMIKASERGAARELAAHLLNNRDNEQVRAVETRHADQDIRVALADWEAEARTTRCKKYLIHASLSPAWLLTEEQWQRAWELYEAEFGLQHQPALEVQHVKEGRVHRHRVYPRIRDDGRLVRMSWMRARNEKIARRLEFEYGHPMVAGRWNRAVEKALREEGHQDVADEVARLGRKARPQAAESWTERQQAKRTRIGKVDAQEAIAQAWSETDSGEEFVRRAREYGMEIAQGEKTLLAVDQTGGVHRLLQAINAVRKRAGAPRLRKADIQARMGALPLPNVARAKRISVARAEPLPAEPLFHPQPHLGQPKLELTLPPEADEEADQERKYRYLRRLIFATYPASFAEELGDRVRYIHPPRSDAPEFLAVLIMLDGNRIEDRGDHLSGWGKPWQLAADMVALALSKGWTSVVATGDPEFLEAVEEECRWRGLDLQQGPDDDEEDEDELGMTPW